jgi:hypothetical protein
MNKTPAWLAITTSSKHFIWPMISQCSCTKRRDARRTRTTSGHSCGARPSQLPRTFARDAPDGPPATTLDFSTSRSVRLPRPSTFSASRGASDYSLRGPPRDAEISASERSKRCRNFSMPSSSSPSSTRDDAEAVRSAASENRAMRFRAGGPKPKARSRKPDTPTPVSSCAEIESRP